MPTIKRDQSIFTVVVLFKTEPEYIDELLEALFENNYAIESQPGYVSNVFHKSHDGQLIMNYAQWNSEEDFDYFLERASSLLSTARAGVIMDKHNVRVQLHTVDVAGIFESTDGNKWLEEK